jgi:acylphosphatase
MASRLERRKVHYTGHVQGVGFRFTAQGVARQFQVAGYVRNLSDGRVELIVEGEPTELDAFLQAVADRMQGYIRHTQVTTLAASGEFDGFTVRS